MAFIPEVTTSIIKHPPSSAATRPAYLRLASSDGKIVSPALSPVSDPSAAKPAKRTLLDDPLRGLSLAGAFLHASPACLGVQSEQMRTSGCHSMPSPISPGDQQWPLRHQADGRHDRAICIADAGAIGPTLAARLVLAGYSVTVGARRESLATIDRDGTRLIDRQGDHGVTASAARASDLSAQDIVFLCPKSQDLPEPASDIQSCIGDDTFLIPVVNGIPWRCFEDGSDRGGRVVRAVDPDDGLRMPLPARQVPGRVSMVTAERVAPGFAISPVTAARRRPSATRPDPAGHALRPVPIATKSPLNETTLTAGSPILGLLPPPGGRRKTNKRKNSKETEMFYHVIRLKMPPAGLAGKRGSHPALNFFRYVAGLGGRYSKWQARRKAADELMALPDYLLTDIGISRFQIDAAVWGSKGRSPVETASRPAALHIRG